MLDPVTCIGCSSCVMIGQSIIGYDVLHNSGKTSVSNEEDIDHLTTESFLIFNSSKMKLRHHLNSGQVIYKTLLKEDAAHNICSI